MTDDHFNRALIHSLEQIEEYDAVLAATKAWERANPGVPIAVDYDPPLKPYEVQYQFTPTLADRINRLSGAVVIFAAGWLFGVITTVMVL